MNDSSSYISNVTKRPSAWGVLMIIIMLSLTERRNGGVDHPRRKGKMEGRT
jgi:hypothetical protein